MSSDRSGLDIPVIQIDGIHIAEHLVPNAYASQNVGACLPECGGSAPLTLLPATRRIDRRPDNPDSATPPALWGVP
jgi:hypothetical protein